MVDSWRIEMFGGLRLVGDGTVVERFRTRRVALLLAHLALLRNRDYSRDEIAELLWPGADEEVLRRNLRQALSSLRHVLEPPPTPFGAVLQIQGNRLRLNPSAVRTDIDEFEKAMAHARRTQGEEQAAFLQRATDLYTGDLLTDLDEDWIYPERFRLEELYLFALQRLAQIARSAGRLEEAAGLLRRRLEREPLSEEPHIALMQLSLELGRPSEAVYQYEQLRALLGDQLGQSPSAVAKEVYEKARTAPARKASPPTEEALPSEVTAPEPPKRTIRLPMQITRFCGREHEIDRTVAQLTGRKARLVSLVGPAGTGKTRLAVEICRRLADTGEWNVWFVPLADLSTGLMAIDAVLDAFSARRLGRADPFDRLREATTLDGNLLLVLDNAEHLIDDVAELASSLTSKIERLQVLVTSRQALRIDGEHLVEVPPLPMPFHSSGKGPLTPQEVGEISRFASVQLFIDRCQMIRPDFQITVNNARAIASICTRLDGIPLALELAAGLSGSFSPAQMLIHLQKRLTQLSSRRRDIPDRHRSLRAAIEYSYDTLPPRLRELFAALSVFRGGFSVEAARSVFPRTSEQDMVELIWELQERSLLRTENAEELTDLRYRLLESFREYGDDRLDDLQRHELRGRHAEFYKHHPPPQAGLGLDERLRRHHVVEAEFENYIAALDFQFLEGNFQACIELLGTLNTAWFSRGPRAIERSYIRRLADHVEGHAVAPESKILLLRMLGTTYIRTSEYAAAYAACRTALGIAERNGLEEQIVVCYLAIATSSGYLGNLDECLDMCEKALERLPIDNLALRERALLGIGAVRWGQGRLVEAEVAYLAAAERSAKANGGEADVLILNNIARVCLDLERYDEAMTLLGDVMRICHRLHDEFGLAVSLSLAGRYYRLRGHVSLALSTGNEALMKFREMDFLHYSLVSIFQQALAIVDKGEWEAGATLVAATQGIGKPARWPDQQDDMAALSKIRSNLSEQNFERAWARGLAMGVEDAFRLALSFH